MHPVKVSIVLPTYNQSMFLLSAIQSIFKQTYDNYELIIVNDGSTDDTWNLLATINHPKIQVITQNNQGLPGALNTGFSKARGEFWTWTSTDNMVAPTWLEELVGVLEKAPSDVQYAFSSYAVIDEADKILFVNRDQRFDLATLLMRHTGNASFLYRSEFAKKIGEYDPSIAYAEDLDMWVRMAEETRAVHVESILYYYRQHLNSMTTQSHKVREATKKVVTKFLAKSNGLFEVEKMFPSISLSENPALEKWKARVWLSTLGANATYYCPVDALVDQLHKALNENYERGLIGNIVHLYAKEDRWDEAMQAVAKYAANDQSDYLKLIATIIQNEDKETLQKIPYLTLEEKYFASDCKGQWSQKQLQRNLAINLFPAKTIHSFESLVADLVKQLEDQNNHPEVWQKFAEMQSPDEKELLNYLRSYLTELINVSQNPVVMMLLKTLEAVCFSLTGYREQAEEKLEALKLQHPQAGVVSGALFFIRELHSIQKEQKEDRYAAKSYSMDSLQSP